MLKRQSLKATEYLTGLTKDNVEEIAEALEKTPAMILQCVNILENWNSKMKNLCSSIFEVIIVIVKLVLQFRPNLQYISSYY